MRIALLLATLTIAWFFVQAKAASVYGPQVAARFLERDLSYTAAQVTHFIEECPSDARHYVVPVLFPVDLVFLTLLAAFLGTASVALAPDAGVPASRIWILALLPAAYFCFDAGEDIWLTRMLSDPAHVASLITIAKSLTAAKIATSALAIGQTTVVAALSALRARSR